MRSILLILLTGVFARTAVSDDRPNVVFMLSDDQNWNGTSVAMHPDVSFSKSRVIDTPSLEKLAEQGMRFSAAYAPASVCSPTRCSLQLGMSTAQTGWTKAAPTMTAADGYRLVPPRITRNLDTRTTTIAEVLREAGYATAHYGKWHLNGGGPGQHGYDDDDGNNGNEYAHRFTDPNPADIFGMARAAARYREASRIDAGLPGRRRREAARGQSAIRSDESSTRRRRGRQQTTREDTTRFSAQETSSCTVIKGSL